MSETTRKSTSRREFLKNTGRIAATSVLAAGIVPRVYAAENNTIKVALVGCGGRGTGAASNALSVKSRAFISKLSAGRERIRPNISGDYLYLSKLFNKSKSDFRHHHKQKTH